MEINWSSLHKTMADETRSSILELLSERDALNYTEIMTVLGVTNTGRLNYHLKALGDLISKDSEGRYRLTEKGQLAVNMLKTFPERKPNNTSSPILRKVVSMVMSALGIVIVGGIAAFGTFLLAVRADLTLAFGLLLGSFFVVGLVLILAGVFTYKNRIWTSL